jgi:hypothetical protein
MDLTEAYILRQAVDNRLAGNQRMQLISAHVAQGHTIDSATTIVDDYLYQQQQAQGRTLGSIVSMIVGSLFFAWVAVILGIMGLSALGLPDPVAVWGSIAVVVYVGVRIVTAKGTN